MRQRLRRWAWSVVRRLGWAGPLLAVAPGGYLHRTGWMRSVHTQRSVDATGAPQPWFAYAFLHFFVPRVQSSWRVCEFGSGASTTWLAARVAAVLSIEHDAEWARQLRPQLPQSVTLVVADEAHYTEPLLQSTDRYDLIVIDGVARPACCAVAPDRLTAGGVIVVDNSERPAYRAALAALEGRGFRRLDFCSLGAISNHETCTSVFYRPDNVLGI